MIEKLIFEYCKQNGDSRLIDIELREKKFILKTATGRNGIYLDTCFHCYKCNANDLKPIICLIQNLNIYKWNRYYPSIYRPHKRLIGNDTKTWTLHYKETNKKTFRHVSGRDSYPPQWPLFIIYLDAMLPGDNIFQWIDDFNIED